MKYKIVYKNGEDVCICPSCGFVAPVPNVVNEDITPEESFKILESISKD